MGYSKKEISYGVNNDESIIVQSLSDELRFVECMKLYKTHETLDAFYSALTDEAKEKINTVY